VSWPKGENRRLSGTIGPTSREGGRAVPLSGGSTGDGGRPPDYERAVLRGPGMRGRVSGRWTPRTARGSRSRGDGDLAATEAVLTRVRRASATRRPAAGFTGAGTFNGSAGHSELAGLRGSLRGAGQNRLLRRGLGARGLEGVLDTAAEAVDSAPSSSEGSGEIVWRAGAEIGWFGLRDALEGRARAAVWPVRTSQVHGVGRRGDGPRDGEAAVRGRRSAPRGGEGHGRAARYYALRYDEARIESR